jgi:hypothetical protein
LEGKFGSIALLTAAGRILSVAILSVPTSAQAAQPNETLATVQTRDLLGRWGMASFELPVDRAITEAAASGQCRAPYVIRAGKSGGVIMHQADQTIPQELWLKSSPSGKKYIGPTVRRPASKTAKSSGMMVKK